MLELSNESRVLAGILLLALLTIEFGGTFMLRVVLGKMPTTDLQKSFFRAGHAHAGVWVTLGLVILVLVDATDLTGIWAYIARVGVPFGAILTPAGFFLSVASKGAEKPNRLFPLVYIGAAVFALGVGAAGIGLLVG